MAIQRGRLIPDEVTVRIGGRAFDGWEGVAISKNLESIANQFSIELFDKFAGLRQNWPLKPGVSARVDINDQRIITGRIEKLDVTYNDERRGYTISGRSKPGDLVDCMHVGDAEFKNIPLDKLAEELVRPFGLRVFLSVEPKVIDKFSVKPGETVFEALDRAARSQGFFFISTRAGNIRLTRAARARAKTSIEQGVNILAATATYDDTQRHDQYIVKGQTVGLPVDLGDFFGEKVTSPEGIAKDLGITRHRPFIMISEANADTTKAQTRAEWEASARLAKSIRVTAAVQGWTQSEGTIWGINQVTPFRSEFLGLNRDLLIVSVEHLQSAESGQVTNLTLTDPEAYNPEPEKNAKAKDNIILDLGSEFAK